MVLPSPDHGTIDNLIASAQLVADSGLGSVWMTHSTGYDPLTALAVMGREVPLIRMASAVTPLQTLHPARLAAQARTTNAAIDGRLVLGVGVSHKPAIEGRFGLPYPSVIPYVTECLGLLRPLIAGESVDSTGEHVSAHFRLTDEGRGGVPILLAALQPRMLALAGGVADGTITWCCGIGSVRSRIAPAVVAAAELAQRPHPEIVVALPVCVTSDLASGREAANAQLRGYERLPVYRAVLDEEGASLPGDISLVGDEESVRSQLAAFAEAGCTTFAAIRCGSEADRARTLELLVDFARDGAG